MNFVEPIRDRKKIAQSAKALPTKGEWRQNYILFSRAPLASAAQQRISELGATHSSIEQIEAEMVGWQMGT